MKRWILAALMFLMLTACGAGETAPAPQEPQLPTPVAEEPAPPASNAGAYQVTVDWSKLDTEEPRQEPVGEKWYDPLPEDLIPSKDYGPLVPYAGQRIYDDWPSKTGCLYGLMTRDGVAVTAPVYVGITRAGTYSHPETLPVILLRRGNPENPSTYGDYAVAAADGSWCTDFEYLGVSADRDKLVLFDHDTVTWMTTEGELLNRWTVEELGFNREQLEMWLSYNGGWVCNCHEDILCVAMEMETEILTCVDLNTGASMTMTRQEFVDLEDWAWMEQPEPVVEGAMRLWDEWLGEAAPGLLSKPEFYADESPIRRELYYREDGTPLPLLTQTNPAGMTRSGWWAD